MSTPTHRWVDERLLGAHIARFAAEAPLRRALVFHDGSWTYGELDRAIRVMAAGIAAADVRRGDVVLMAGTARPEAVCTLFALARLGAVVVPVNPSSTSNEISAVAAAVAPVAIVGDADFLARCTEGGLHLSWDVGTPRAVVVRPDADLRPLDVWDSRPDEPAVIAFTSGTSGRARGVVLSHANLFWSTRLALACMSLGPDDTVLVATPLAHAAVFSGLPQHVWAVGGSVVLTAGFDPDRFLEAVHRHRVTTAFAVSAMLGRLVRSPLWTTIGESSLRFILVGGGPALESLTLTLAQAGVLAINSYGLTEASGGVSYARPDEVVDHPLAAGPPAPGVELRIAAIGEISATPGVPGEIWLRGPSLAREYVQPDGTRTPVSDPEGWLHTGDRGLIDPAGRLYVTGRIKDTIITGGENVDPVEVEDALSTMPGVRDATVVGLADPERGEVVTAVLVLEPGSTAGLDDVREHLRSRLAPHKIPRRLIRVDDLPRTATGKVQRGILLTNVTRAAGDSLDPES